MKMADRQCSSSLWDTHLQPEIAKPLLHTHIKEEEEKRLFTLCNHMGVWCACGCVNVCACVCAHLSACLYELFVSPPQALGCWVCSLKRLCFCCHLPLSRSVFLTHTLTLFYLCFVSLSVSFTISLLSICNPLSIVVIIVRNKAKFRGVSHLQPFTSSTGNDLMLFEREAG